MTSVFEDVAKVRGNQTSSNPPSFQHSSNPRATSSSGVTGSKQCAYRTPIFPFAPSEVKFSKSWLLFRLSLTFSGARWQDSETLGSLLVTRTLVSILKFSSTTPDWPRRVSVTQGLPGGYEAAESRCVSGLGLSFNSSGFVSNDVWEVLTLGK